MSEEIQERRFEVPLDAEGTEDEFSKQSGRFNIRYSRASLLELSELETCHKFPGDFDMLILRDSQLDGASNGLTEPGKISCNSSGSFPSTRRDLGFTGERQDDQLGILSKDGCSKGTCSSDRNTVKCQHIPSEFECNAGILGQKIQKCDLFQLRKSENPYRPPHCVKKMPQPLDTSSALQVDCLGQTSFAAIETNLSVSSDNLTETDTINSPLDDSWRHNKRSGRIDPKLELGINDDNKLFDDCWAEILEIIQLQQEPKLSSDVSQDNAPDSEVEHCLPGKNSLVLADGAKSEMLNFTTLDNDELADSEAEINLPDEDGLISIDDIMLVPPIAVPTLDRRNCVAADKATSNAAAKLRNNPASLYVTKPDDHSTALSFSGLDSQGKLLPQLPHSQASDMFAPENPYLHLRNDQMSLLSEFMVPNSIPYLPTLDWYSCSDFHPQPSKETILTRTKSNDSLVQYSLWQQPKICPEQVNHLLAGTCPMKQVTTPDLNAMQFLHSTPQRTIFQGLGTSTTGGFGDKDASSFWHNQC